jgi:signal transduction histidine kinase
MRSLTARLSGVLIVALIILAVTLLAGLHYSLHHLAVTFISTRLDHDLENLLSSLSFDSQLRPQLDETQLTRLFREPYSGYYYKIFTTREVLRSRSLWDAELDLPAGGLRENEPVFVSGPDHQHVLALQRSYRRQGQPVAILVTADFEPIALELKRLQWRIGLAGLAILSVLLLAQYFIVRRGLYPLHLVGRELQRLAAGEISQLNPRVPREIRPLVTELNRLLEALSQRLSRSRHALGNLAHALKTPLAVLIQAAEQVPGGTGAELKQQAAQIESLIAREL